MRHIRQKLESYQATALNLLECRVHLWWSLHSNSTRKSDNKEVNLVVKCGAVGFLGPSQNGVTNHSGYAFKILIQPKNAIAK